MAGFHKRQQARRRLFYDGRKRFPGDASEKPGYKSARGYSVKKRYAPYARSHIQGAWHCLGPRNGNRSEAKSSAVNKRRTLTEADEKEFLHMDKGLAAQKK